MVIRPVPKNVYLFSKKEEWNLLKWEQKCKEKDLIWPLVGEIVKNRVRQRVNISFNYSCTSYFLVKILFDKLKNLHISACLKLNYCTTNHSQKYKGCKDGGIYQDLWPIKNIFKKCCSGEMGNSRLPGR